ncbi:hypothetical protein KI387_021295 [Taxus chinensis]|uniref:TIR domain-containing protein n=1 Tax=Taxus chinensis TaxID=29808 RepID=A0AA38GAL2_TAXCH|nr:hypothetical protein KI387_021295 [Taxus chinensis]
MQKKKYHVFLSFRSKDTRQNIADHLFESLSAAGVRVFLDSERLRKGEDIGLSLKEAIQGTDIHIPIFSPNYAKSAWCLKEVTEMSRSKGLIIPLFYGVEPADVKYPDQRPMYADAFNAHDLNRRHKPETVSEWKNALRFVSSLSGWSINTTSGYEGKLVKRVLSDVLNTLNNVPLDVTKYAVGLKERIDDVVDLLTKGVTGRVVTVGIWGTGGVGKTTLAKAVYNNIFCNFDAASFVSDVRANTEHRINGLCKLQRQLLRDLLKTEFRVNNIDHGKAIMKEHLQSIRALVILDDVDHRKQLETLGAEWLGAGSKVIVTTRDKSVLNTSAAEDEVSETDDRVYTLHELEKNEALQLFSWHAFLKAYPDKDYEQLSKRIVNTCCGLPLSLEVLGTVLYNRKDKRCWKEAVSQLESARCDDIYRSLKISYENLNLQEKELFLDIACFFIGQDQETAISFWEDLNLNPHLNLSNLVLKSLVKIDNKQEIILMHDHLRDMGRAIVADESRDPAKRSRVWRANEAYQALQNRRELDCVESISVSGSKQSIVVLEAEDLRSMRNVHLIWLDRTNIGGDPQPLSLNLRWLRWNSCPWSCLPSEWSMEHLVVLDLSTRQTLSHLNQLWDEHAAYKKPKNLRVLLLGWCVNLKRLPDLSNYTSLLRIDLKNCSGLRKLPESIGLLLQLKYLNLSGCKNLEELPESIGELSSLENLSMNGCLSIRKLPSTFGMLRALKDLDIGHLEQIQELPPFETDWWLKKLIISGCHRLRSLPTSIGELRCLNYLEMNECSSLSHLPKEFGNLESINELFVNGCPCLQGLPESFGKLTNLTTLELKNDVSLIGLPQHFSRLRSLDMSFIQEFSANGMKLESFQVQDQDLESFNFIDMFSFPLRRNSRCAGAVLFFDLKISREIHNALASLMEIALMKDGEEIFRAKEFIQKDEQFMFIFRAKHPVIVALQNAQRVSIQGRGKEIHIKEGGLRIYRKILEPSPPIIHTIENGTSEINKEKIEYN